MFDVFGNVIDRGAELSDVRTRSVHRAPPPLARRSTQSEIFATGIKVIAVLPFTFTCCFSTAMRRNTGGFVSARYAPSSTSV